MTSNMKSSNRLQSPSLAPPNMPHSPRTESSSSQHLNNIFSAVRRQIEQWGDQAKWKIDLVLLENADGTTPQPESPAPNMGSVTPRSTARSPFPSENGRHSTPQQAPSATLNSVGKRLGFQPQYPPQYVMPPMQHALPRTFKPTVIDPSYPASTDPNYPMRPRSALSEADINRLHHLDDAKQKLRECVERINFLDSIVRSQSEQLYQLQRGQINTDATIETMRKIYLMNEHEQALKHSVETKMFQKDIRVLAQKLKKAYSKIRLIESADISTKSNNVDRATLLQDRKILLRKLRLSEMRSATKDIELDMLSREYQKIIYNRDTPELRPVSIQGSKSSTHSRRAGNRYLLQQGYSPSMRQETPPLSKQRSGLDSLGIVANQMLTDMDKTNVKEKEPEVIRPANDNAQTFQASTSKRVGEISNPRDEKRSQRSIDSATALLSMQPTTEFPGQEQKPTSVPNIAPTRPVDINKPQELTPLWERRRSQAYYVKWLPSEDEMLRAAVQRYGSDDWNRVAEDMPQRNHSQCRQRWLRLMNRERTGRTSMDASQSPAISNLLTQQQPSLESPSPPRSAPHDDEPHTPPHQVQFEHTHELPRKAYELYPPALQEKHSRYHPSTMDRQEATLLQPQSTPTGLYRPPSPIATPKKRKIETIP